MGLFSQWQNSSITWSRLDVETYLVLCFRPSMVGIRRRDTTSRKTAALVKSMPEAGVDCSKWGGSARILLFPVHHFHFPAQLAGVFTPGGTLNKPCQMYPPILALVFSVNELRNSYSLANVVTFFITLSRFSLLGSAGCGKNNMCAARVRRNCPTCGP